MSGPKEEGIQYPPPRWLQMMWQGAAILVSATLIGLSVNALRPAKLPLVADWSLRSQLSSAPEGDGLTIAFEDAQVLFLDRGAVFVDARPVESFLMGHIEGARSLPWHDFDSRFSEVMSDLPLDSIIITYCDGENCGLSRELALALSAKGYQRVHVLLDGWRLWQEYNLPFEQ